LPQSSSGLCGAIVGKSADPIRAGFVETLARPGGNITGFHQFRIRDGKQMATPHAGLERSNARTTKQSEQLDTNRCESGDAVARWSAK
jgi:hypothetical protein